FREQARVRLSDASEHLGVAHSTAHRLLAMLTYHGFVRQEQDSRAYGARPALVEIGLAAVRQLDIRLLARPVLEDLAATFAETAHLPTLDRPGSDGPSELPSLTKRSVTSLTRLRAELRRVRERGYALNTEESEEGVASVAVAVLCHRDAPIAALAVSAPV